MATALPLQPQSWDTIGIEHRSVALAEAHGFTAGAARFYVGLRDGCETFKVLSERTHKHDYFVTYDPRTDRIISCTCPSRGACKHIGAARLWVERRKVATAPVDADSTPATPAPVLTVLPVAPRIVPTFTSPVRAFGTCEGCGQTGRVLLAHTYPHDGGVEIVRMCADGCEDGALDLTA